MAKLPYSMPVSAAVSETERRAMNEVARSMAWEWHGRGMRAVTEAMRSGIENGYRPTHAELVKFCELMDAQSRAPK